MSAFVRVVLDRSIRRELDYAVPDALAEKVAVGSRIRVPFRDKSLLATVVAELDESPAEGIKPIEALIGEKPTLSSSLIELARWMANYYCCPIETVMKPATAGNSKGESQLEKTAFRGSDTAAVAGRNREAAPTRAASGGTADCNHAASRAHPCN